MTLPPGATASAGSAEPVASPCTQVCRIDPSSGFCIGCARSLDEIAAWTSLGDAARRRVLARLDSRRGLIDASAAPPAP